MEEETRLLSVDEVAERLHIKPKHVHYLCRTGQLEYVAVMPRIRAFLPESVGRYIESHTRSVPKKAVDKGRATYVGSTPNCITKKSKGGDATAEETAKALKEEMASW